MTGMHGDGKNNRICRSRGIFVLHSLQARNRMYDFMLDGSHVGPTDIRRQDRGGKLNVFA